MRNGFLKYQLADRVNEALDKIGFKKPTAVQEEVIPLMLSKRNVVVEAATGTGKTAAYGLALMSRIDYIKRSTQVLVLVPSRELALQVETALRTFTTNEKFRVASVYGGMSLAESEKKIKSSPHILVAVPGRLKDVLRVGKLDHFWRDIKFLVIDEVDKLLESGFQEILDNLVSHLRNMVQVALFSATINADVEALIRERFYPLQVVRLGPEEALRNIFFHYIVVDQGQKQRYLAALILTQKVRQALIFTPNRDEVYSLANFLRGMGLKAEAYHGLLDQVERTAVMKRFKNKQVNYLVATDLAARGLDVVGLPAVINYAFPDELEIYLHRCGRTGRAGKKGAVYNLVASKKEEIMVESFHGQLKMPLRSYAIEPLAKEDVQHVEGKLVKVHLSKGKRDKISSGDIVGFLVNATGVDADKIGTIAIYDAYTLADLPEWALEVLELSDNDLKLKGKSVKVTKFSLDDQKHKAEALRKSQIGVRDRREIKERVARDARHEAKTDTPDKKTDGKTAKVTGKPRSKKATATDLKETIAPPRAKGKPGEKAVATSKSTAKAPAGSRSKAKSDSEKVSTTSKAGTSKSKSVESKTASAAKPRGKFADEKPESVKKGAPLPPERKPKPDFRTKEKYNDGKGGDHKGRSKPADGKPRGDSKARGKSSASAGKKAAPRSGKPSFGPPKRTKK